MLILFSLQNNSISSGGKIKETVMPHAQNIPNGSIKQEPKTEQVDLKNIKSEDVVENELFGWPEYETHNASNSTQTQNSRSIPKNSVSSTIANTPSKSVVKIMSDQFSIDFSEWFYTMLNRLQPECSQQRGDTLRPEIFFSNCKVDMYLVEGDRTEHQSAEGNLLCNTLIRKLLTNLKLLFTPNLDGGLQAKKSSHGMIQLFCCGTLHSQSSFLGIFEQEFGLVMCPVGKVWKISYTKINLKKVHQIQSPTLPQMEKFAIEL